MDIREILAAIDEKDRQLWSDCRTNMRKVFISAHNKVVGIANWSHIDDAFLDMMDIQLANLFDRAGRINSPKPIVSDEDAEKIKNDLLKSDDDITLRLSDLPKNEWK